MLLSNVTSASFATRISAGLAATSAAFEAEEAFARARTTDKTLLTRSGSAVAHKPPLKPAGRGTRGTIRRTVRCRLRRFVPGRKPTSRIRSSTSAYVSSTSPGCIGRKFFWAGLPTIFLDQLDEVAQLNRLVVADVVNAKGGQALVPGPGSSGSRVAEACFSGLGDAVGDADHAFDNVVDVGEIACLSCLWLKTLMGRSLRIASVEEPDRHVGPSPEAHRR